jgi:hypothetical protein
MAYTMISDPRDTAATSGGTVTEMPRLRRPWLYPHRSLEPDLAEAAALAYLLDPRATYAAIARTVACAWITVWRWVARVASRQIVREGLGRAAALLGRDVER